jgi:hypothetical protein
MFGSIDIKVRPIKIAYLVDPNNAKQVREAIRLNSTLWGGVYFPIIPLYKRMPATWREGPLKAPPAKNVILGYIEAFDPDILVQFSKEIPAYITALGLEITKPEEIWQPFDAEKHLSPKFGLGIYELLKDVFEEYFKYKTKYRPKVVIPRIPDQLSLFWASLFGEIPSKLLPVLEEHYFEPLEAEVMDFQPDKLLEIMGGNVFFPRRITQRGLNHFNRSGSHYDASIYFLDATKVEDIVDFWNLRAMGKQVVPVPKQLTGSPQLKEVVIDFLKAHRRPWRHNPKVCDHASIIRARSCTMEEMQEYAKMLEIDRAPDDPSDSPYFSLQHWYPRVWDEWARDKDGAVPGDMYGKEMNSIEINDAKELNFRFKSLLPKFAQQYGYHGEPRCANEISFRFYGSEEYLAEVLPKSSGENFTRAISSLASFRGDWRVGRNGLVKLVKDSFTETRDVPTAENIMFAWLADLGWKSKLSPPGLLAKQIYRKLEGHLTVLKNEQLLGLLEHMNGGLVKKDGSPTDENKVSQERDLPVGEVKSRLGASSRKGDLYGYLLSKEIFKLGLRMQCSNCLRNSWFSLEDVRASFTCPRCQSVFPAVGNLENAKWCYKTSGPFSVPKYADGAYAVLLTLEFFDDHNMHTMRTTRVLSFEGEAPNRKTLETDFALFWEESIFGEKKDGIMFGECKTYGRFGKQDFERMRYLAKSFPGAVLVFSTLRKSLTVKEISGISRIAKVGRKYWKAERPINPVLVLTGTELLSWHGPPYCWEDSIKKKFDRMFGLLGVCDATQQIYLNLPSWHTEWREQWEKKHERRKVRQGAISEVQEMD